MQLISVFSYKHQYSVSCFWLPNLAFSYFIDGLAEELICTGIFTNAVKVAPGIWEGNIDLSRIFNHDETPQFINYGVDGTPNGLVYAGRGETCKLVLQENRESVTVHPLVSFAGNYLSHESFIVCLCVCVIHTKHVNEIV